MSRHHSSHPLLHRRAGTILVYIIPLTPDRIDIEQPRRAGVDAGINVFASVDAAKGNGAEWTETTLDKGKTVTINSGRDMVLNGDQNVTQYVHLTFIRPNILMNGD